MRTMKPCAILRHERFAMMRFFDHGMYYLCGTFDELAQAQDMCDQMNEKMHPMYDDDQYEVVVIDHREGDEAE